MCMSTLASHRIKAEVGRSIRRLRSLVAPFPMGRRLRMEYSPWRETVESMVHWGGLPSIQGRGFSPSKLSVAEVIGVN